MEWLAANLDNRSGNRDATFQLELVTPPRGWARFHRDITMISKTI